jgi:bifunctional non-homologous end joining protein LigD
MSRTVGPQASTPTLVDGRVVHLRNLGKELWPGSYTKADLLSYFLAVAPAMLPHLAGRPASFTRWPDGITGKMFYQKNPPAGTPAWIPTWPSGGTRYLLVEERATLAFLAQMAVIEIHTWPARVPDVEHPDLAVIDLDPMPPFGFEAARTVARLVHAALETLHLTGFVKTSGATGLHIYLPIVPRYDARTVTALVKRLAEAVRAAAPDLVTLERRVRERWGVYFDYGQNAPTRTMAAPYSPRPLPGAPVSTPITWEELDRVEPEAFTLATVPTRIEQDGDPWRDMRRAAQPLDALRRLAP